MKAIVIAFLLLATTALGVHSLSPRLEELDHYTFDDYARAFGKSYATAEERARREQIFSANLKMVRAHNAKADKLYTMNVNHMSDWTKEEFGAMLGQKPLYRRNLAGHMPHMAKGSPSSDRKVNYPTRVDWREHKPMVVTPVKNQGGCGSCWAFGAVETMESRWAIHTSQPAPELSPQQLTSCTPNPRHCGGNGGCEGATAELAYEYVIKNGGIVSEKDYPYKAVTGVCKIPPTAKYIANFSKFIIVSANDQNALLEAVAKGPVSIGVWATPMGGYHGGIFDGCNYNENMDINHAVQLVGYGTDDSLGKDYWIVRNSWGDGWGEGGYIRLLREKEAKCGWDKTPKDGSACQDDPDDPVKVCGQCGILSGTSYPVV